MILSDHALAELGREQKRAARTKRFIHLSPMGETQSRSPRRECENQSLDLFDLSDRQVARI